jgi:hypothetical protein
MLFKKDMGKKTAKLEKDTAEELTKEFKKKGY